MKILKLLCVSAALTAGLAASAQNGKALHQNNWFIGAGGGFNVSLDGQKYVSREVSHAGAGTAADFYFGKYFSDFWGFRVGYQGLNTSDQYVDYAKLPYRYAHADALMRVGKVAVPYLHAGYAWLNRGSAAGGVGLMLPVRLSRRVNIVPDFKATAMDGAVIAGNTGRIAVNLSATLGLQIALGKVKDTRRPDVPVDPSWHNPDPGTTVVTPPAPDKKDQTEVSHEFDGSAHQADAKKEQAEVARPSRHAILFAFDSDEISPEMALVVGDWADYLLAHPDKPVLIEGHTCNMGGESVNVGLSRRRAESVRHFLVYRGVDPDRISIGAFGSSRPAVSNDTPDNRALNRRAEIIVK